MDDPWHRLDNPMLQRALVIIAFIMVWKLFAATVAVAAGLQADSIALLGFGLDSGIAVLTAGLVVCHLRGTCRDRYQAARRVIALSLVLLAVVVAFDALSDLIRHEQAAPSLIGIVLSDIALVVMAPVAIVHYRTGAALENQAVMTQAWVIGITNYVSLSLTIGLGANALFGWWWADPVVALLIAGSAVWEGKQAWQEATNPTRNR